MASNNQFDPKAHVYEDRTTTWSCVGKDVSDCTDAAQVLRESGLDYTVEKLPLEIPDSHGQQLEGRVVTARPETEGWEEWHVYDVVSSSYEIVQNADAFAFVDYMGDVRFEKAGETASGMSYIIAALPETEVLGDTFVPHVILRNSFGGNSSVQAAICPLRMVCQNQFAVAFREAGNTVRIRHVANAQERMEEAREVLRANAEYMGLLRAEAERLAAVRVSDRDREAVVEALFPMGGDPAEVNSFRRFRVMNSRAEFQHAYAAPDNENFRGTAWGLVNAYADYMTHTTPQGNRDSRFENRMMATTFRPKVNRVIEVIDSLAIAA